MDPANSVSPAISIFSAGKYRQTLTPAIGRPVEASVTFPLIILRGCMEIGLQDGSARRFGPGEHFYSADTLPEGAVFDAAVHGHWTRQVGDEPLVTLFVRG